VHQLVQYRSKLRAASTSDGWVNDGDIQIMNTVLMQAQELRQLY
jgi:hypothetical protein